MRYTEVEHRVAEIYRLHRYDAFANPDKVGLGRCGCGVDMYYCEHDLHFARALVTDAGLNVREVRRLPDPYPPNVECACGDLIHLDMPSVVVEADGVLWHGNADGGGHRADVDHVPLKDRI